MTNFKGMGAAALTVSAMLLLALATGCNKATSAQAQGAVKTQAVSTDSTQKVAADSSVAGTEAKEGGCSDCAGCAGKDKGAVETTAADASLAGDETVVADNASTSGEVKGDCQNCADCKAGGSCEGDCAGKGCENADKKAGECSGGSCEGCPGKDAKTEEEQTTENTSTV